MDKGSVSRIYKELLRTHWNKSCSPKLQYMANKPMKRLKISQIIKKTLLGRTMGMGKGGKRYKLAGMRLINSGD